MAPRNRLSHFIQSRRPNAGDYRRRFRMRISEWATYYYEEVLLADSHWMGVRALKNPLDAWVYQEIIHETRPDIIIELGNAYGGGSLFLAHMLDLLGSDAQVICVDHSHEAFAASHPRITTVTGDTRAPEVLERVHELRGTNRGMLIHDASHDEAVVLEDLRNYAPVVAPGCYLIVEDGVGDVIPPRKGGRATPGPLIAARRFLDENDEFELDAGRERHIATYNPQGFLRRRET